MSTNHRRKITRNFTITLSAFYCLAIQSCKNSPTDFAAQWTKDMKTKIIEDANQPADRTFVDSVHHEITLFKNNKKLQQYFLAERENQSENETTKIYDTAMIVFYSTDQNFQWIRQLIIPQVDKSYEGIGYKNDRFGLAEYIYSKDHVKQIGFHFKNLNVGTWTTYDSTGKQTGQIDNGNTTSLEKLREMKYYR